jgi:hypothetical protein
MGNARLEYIYVKGYNETALANERIYKCWLNILQD